MVFCSARQVNYNESFSLFNIKKFSLTNIKWKQISNLKEFVK